VQAPFGRYELIRLLDHGGMGEVWLARARGPERVHKTVVLKRIRAERANDDAARARFAEEARVAIALSHPHIVPVFEFGELDGAYFLVMEWLRGGNLARVAGVDRAPLPWPATALIGTQLCDALAYVHARTNKAGARLVHGDVTPRNVLFSTDGHALLADFGLARFAGRGGAGTLRYLSPEQARGDAFDARADLYALALVLSEAATGQPAYDRDGERAVKQAKVGVIPDFGGCDDGLASVLRRALAGSADGRFADAAVMRAAFEALLDREPGARAAGRAEIVARCAAPSAASEGGEASRTATQATREATVAALPSRWRLGAVAGLVAVAGVALWAAGVGRHHDGGHGHDGAARAATASSLPLASAPHAAAAPSPVVAVAPSPVVAAPPPVVAAPSPVVAASPPVVAAPSLAKSAARAPMRAATRHADAPHARPASTAPAAPALLDVNATPWAHVRVDGTPRGETPLLGLSLPAGTHSLELSNEPLGLHRELTVTLRPGEHATRVEDLSR
jgi:tRNA A-37 threonylcarbamoyl transferase component Bud32